jgi:hypothetical protein
VGKQLVGIAYDPTTAVTKATTALLAVTAIDTTNLRGTFTCPASGRVKVLLAGTLHGAATYPQTVLAVLDGATVRGRVVPEGKLNGVAAATQMLTVTGEFTVSGLTPGNSYSFDAAYGVETLVASTGLKYGGPNNTTANDAFGAFIFEIWDVTT